MELTAQQKQEFYQSGFVKVPGAVSQELVDAARRAINASLGNEGIDPALLTKFRSQSYCPELQGTPVITDLINASSVHEYAESAIGVGKIRPVRGGQIALRFPSTDPPREPGPHIDGMYSPTNGVQKGTIANFTALVGIVLSELPHDYMGNLALWPGTHRLYERYFQDHGPEALLEGMPRVELPQPVQITGNPGDAVLCHYQLAHGIAGNSSPYVRYAIYFRLKHVDHDAIHWECMTDIWREWEGMQEVVTAQG
ncbi:MAG: phytanoyl-CoA dioxygenase family protein [Chloroflexota bacterium]